MFESFNIIIPAGDEYAQSKYEDFLSYENSTFGISMQYPADWEKIERDKIAAK